MLNTHFTNSSASADEGSRPRFLFFFIGYRHAPTPARTKDDRGPFRATANCRGTTIFTTTRMHALPKSHTPEYENLSLIFLQNISFTF